MATFQRRNRMPDEVETLKRELEALKLQLEKERRTNTAVQGGTDSPKQMVGRPPHRDESPEPKRRGGDAKASGVPKGPRIYVQHATVGTRRGKWWLRDRQVLSRATPEEGGATLKLRETWVWSGRTVILDKIVRIEEVHEDDAMEEEEKAKLQEKEPEGANMTSGVLVDENPVAGVASPPTVSREAQESEAAAMTTGEEAVAAKAVVKEEALSAKADDEVRESSAPILPVPPVASDNM